MRRKTRRVIAIGVAALSCFLVVAYVFSESKTRSLAENSPRNEKSELVRLLENHCNTVNALENIYLPESSEGILQNAEIRQIQVVTRHGDRSAIFTTPMTHSNRFRCPRESDYAKTSESPPLSPCRASQLTRTGCEQHRKLGNFFKRAYGLSNEDLESKMRISSTRYQRTIKSAECLVSGLLGDDSFSQSEIHLTSSDCFATSDDADTGYLQRCPRLNSIWARLKLQSKYVTMATRWDAIRRRVVDFAGGRSDLSLTAIGDTVYTHYCHLRKSLGDPSVTPCLSPGHCLPEPLTLEVVKAYDECTTFNYTEEVGSRSQCFDSSFCFSSSGVYSFDSAFGFSDRRSNGVGRARQIGHEIRSLFRSRRHADAAAHCLGWLERTSIALRVSHCF